MTAVGEIIVSDETGFPWNRAKLVESGVIHLRPFNIGDDGQLDFSQKYFVPATAASEAKTSLLAGDVLFNNTNSVELVGKSALVLRDTKAAFSNHITRIRVNADLVEPAYFSLWLRFEQAKGTFAAAATQWVSQAAYRASDMMRLQIPLPPLPEQRRLVELLSRAEGIVRLRREAQAKAAELIPALFLDMFGDPAGNPKGWPLISVGELVDRFEGGKNVQAGDEGASPFRILKISAVTSGTYIEIASKPAPSDLDPPASYFVKPGDLLISRANTEALVGAVALVDQTDRKTLLPDKLWRFVWRDETTILSSFALHLFQQPAVRAMLSSIASGTGGSMKNISQAKLKTLCLPIPPLDLQRQFATKAEAVRAIAAQQTAALQKAQAAFEALLHKAFAS